jgi:high-affinity iron transporter
MLAIAIIVFREVLEASLIVGIVLAASVGIPGRGRWVACGIGAGVLGAALVAAFAASIAGAFAGNGQELLNAAVLCLAVCMLGWHNIWIARHAREIAANAGDVGRQVASGARPLAALALITGAAVLREGSETVLFVFGILAGTNEGFPALLAGGLLGLAGGVAAGATIYFGLLRIPLHRLFVVTGWMVLLLACGLAAQAAAFLVQANLLPALGNQVWDTSWLLSEEGIPGRVLHTLIGYVARPEGVQIVAFVATLVAIGVPMRLTRRPRRAAVAAAALLAAGMLGLPHDARAEPRAGMPAVDCRGLALQHTGPLAFGPQGFGFDHAQSCADPIGYRVRPCVQPGTLAALETG